jgi:hypothetical protein
MVVLSNLLFRCQTLKSVVQVSSTLSSAESFKGRGVEVALRSLEFKGIENIDERLNELSRDGILKLIRIFLLQASYG